MRQRGFTLVEVLIAAAVLSIVVVPFVSVYATGLRVLHSTRLQTIAAYLAQSKVEEAIASPHEQRPGLATEGRVVHAGDGRFSYERFVEDAGEGVYRVTVVVYWTDGSAEKSFRVVTLLAP